MKKPEMLNRLRADRHVHTYLPLLWTVVIWMLWEKLNTEIWHILLSLLLVAFWALALSNFALPKMEEKEAP